MNNSSVNYTKRRDIMETSLFDKIRKTPSLDVRYFDMVKGVQFIEDSHYGYRERTLRNIIESDMTIIFAADDTTAGEKLTLAGCRKYNKPFLKFALPLMDIKLVKEVINKNVPDQVNSINIAGNGLYTLQKYGYTQFSVEVEVIPILLYLFLKTKVRTVRSGGQSGIDEVGIKAGILYKMSKHGGDTKVIGLFPKGYRFRDINNKDHNDKEMSLNRFGSDLYLLLMKQRREQ